MVTARNEKLAVLTGKQERRWLTGFREQSSTEALGELLADIDGKNEPLTLGYHKVSVDIRDQIARTVVEESFVNHTDNELGFTEYFRRAPGPRDGRGHPLVQMLARWPDL